MATSSLVLALLPGLFQLGGADTLVLDLAPGPASSNVLVAATVGELAFATSSNSVGTTVWASDGTPAGTEALTLVASFDGQPGNFVAVGGRMLFDDHSFLWSSDGTAADTAVYASLLPGFGTPSLARWSAPLGQRAIFAVRGVPAGASELHEYVVVTDGTLAGTQVVAETGAALSGWGSDEFVLFHAEGLNGEGFEPWVTDGTAAGTGLLADLNPTGSSDVRAGAFLNGVFVGGIAPDGFDHELWSSDGTPAGTALLKEILPGPGASDPKQFAHVGAEGPGGGVLVFAATGAEGREAWRTDGTAAGTYLLADVLPGSDGGLLSGPTAAGDVAYFAARSSVGGPPELWRTDGTPSGTSFVASFEGLSLNAIWPGLPDGRVVFAADGGAEGTELWVSDGTAAGTRLVADIHASSSSSPKHFRRAGANVLFAADDGVHGLELHAVTLPEIGGHAVQRYGAGCGAGATAPVATWSGSPTLGDAFSVGVENAAPLATTFQFYGTGFAAAPLGGCTLLLDGPLLLASYPTDATGSGAVPAIVVPNLPELAGLLSTFQSATPTPGGPALGAELSDGLEVVFGP